MLVMMVERLTKVMLETIATMLVQMLSMAQSDPRAAQAFVKVFSGIITDLNANQDAVEILIAFVEKWQKPLNGSQSSPAKIQPESALLVNGIKVIKYN
jgi:hypothetical protein